MDKYFRNQCVDSILLPKRTSALADEAVTQMRHNTALVSGSSPRVFDLGFLRYCVRVFVAKITFLFLIVFIQITLSYSHEHCSDSVSQSVLSHHTAAKTEELDTTGHKKTGRDEQIWFTHSFQAGTASPIPSVPRVSLFLCAVTSRRHTSQEVQCPSSAERTKRSGNEHIRALATHFVAPTVASAPAMHTRSYIGNVRKSSNKRGAAPLQFCAASRLHCLHQFTGYWAESHWALSTLPFVATFSSHVAYSS